MDAKQRTIGIIERMLQSKRCEMLWDDRTGMRRQERRDKRTEDVVEEGLNCGEWRRFWGYVLTLGLRGAEE